MLPLFLLVKVTFSISEATTLADLLALRLHQMEDAVRSIVDKAVKELGTEKVGSWVSFQTGLILRVGTSDDSGSSPCRGCVETGVPACPSLLVSV